MSERIRYKFGKEEKLKSKKDIAHLFTSGEGVTKYPVMAKFRVLRSEEESWPKVVVTVSKRSFKKAVDRNRIKRLLREAYRLNNSSLKAVCKQEEVSIHICFIYLAKRKYDYEGVSEAMKVVLDQISSQVKVDVQN